MSLQDMSLVRSNLEKIASDFGLKDVPDAFYFLALAVGADVPYNDADDQITDNHYLTKKSSGGHDRGIDAIYIDESSAVPVIHLFNCKYTEKFDKAKGFIPASEIDKVLSFFHDLMEKDETICDTINPVLFSKVEEIWGLFEISSPRFVVHFCANHYKGFEEKERRRIEKALKRYSHVALRFELISDYVSFLTKGDLERVDAELRLLNKEFFVKTDGDSRALIANIDARDLIRIVINEKSLREKVHKNAFSKLKNHGLCLDAFDENVRVYLKQRTQVNKNIKKTALSGDGKLFFYFNNGVTITCDKFSYPSGQRSPLVSLENLQIVNGGQTIHSLFEAFKEKSSALDDIEVLCRIYETTNKQLSTKIAEYTNSQNPVSTRDIRAIDFVQEKLEAELKAKGYFYERKTNQHVGRPRANRIDAEKAGQAMMAFYLERPGDAKTKKRLVFGDAYEEVFPDSINAEKVLLAYTVYLHVEKRRHELRRKVAAGNKVALRRSYALHSLHYHIYLMKRLADKNAIPLKLSNRGKIEALYDEADKIIQKVTKAKAKAASDEYNHPNYFKQRGVKAELDALL